jgi:hypothetical protein
MAFVTTGLTHGGLTTHFQIKYHNSLSTADGKHLANALIAVCETDYKLMSDWFGGIAVAVPITVQIDKTLTDGATWKGEWEDSTVTLAVPSGITVDRLRYALVAEVTEMFMRAQGKGWYGTDNEGSAGEGLSHFLANQFLLANRLGVVDPSAFPANEWMSTTRDDYVNIVDPNDYSAGPKSGCAILFIYFLNLQLGFSVNRIIAAAAPHLTGNLTRVYKNLTGKHDNPFPHFKQLLDTAFPGKAEIPPTTNFSPFPLDFGPRRPAWRLLSLQRTRSPGRSRGLVKPMAIVCLVSIDARDLNRFKSRCQ